MNSDEGDLQNIGEKVEIVLEENLGLFSRRLPDDEEGSKCMLQSIT